MIRILSHLSILLLFAPLLANAYRYDAEEALTIYKKQLVSERSGSYFRQGWIFFLSDQRCFKDKQKYAGSRESKAATAQAMAMMAEYLLTNQPLLPRAEIGGEGRLWDDLYLQYKNIVAAESRVVSTTSRRILDKDMGGCTRRVVYAVPEKALENVQLKRWEPVDLKVLLAGLFQTALDQQDFGRIAEYFNDLELYELAIAFTAMSREKFQSWLYPANIDWYVDGGKLSEQIDQCQLESNDMFQALNQQLLNILKASYCGQQIDWSQNDLNYLARIKMDSGRFDDVLKAHDHQHVIKMVMKQRGFVLFKNTRFLTGDVELLNSKAESLFNAGKESENIIRMYSLSLNANPSQADVWGRIGAVMLAYQHHDVAYAMFMQAVLQNPLNSDYWIYLIKSMKGMGYQGQAQNLLKATIDLSTVFPPSAWGKAQLKKINS